MSQQHPTAEEILSAANALGESSDPLDGHLQTIAVLRRKSKSWREIADFFRGMGVNVDHTKVFRFAKTHQVELNQLLKGVRMQNARNATVPAAAEYTGALETLSISDTHRKMLGAHYLAHNRSITYTKLAEAVGSTSHVVANKAYGQLGKMLGERLNFNFIWAEHRGAPFYSSAIGMDNPYVPPGQHYELVMHHELAKALDTLGWYEKAVEVT